MDMPNNPSEMLTPNQAAELLGTSAASIRRWVKAGTLPAFTIGGRVRIARSDVLAMVRRVETTGPAIPTRAEVVAREKWVDETLRKAKIRK